MRAVSRVRPAKLIEWDGSEFPLLSNEEIENLPLTDQIRYVERLHSHMLDNDRDRSPWYHEWKRYDARCREDDCTGTRYEEHRFCVRHLDIDTIDPNGAVNRRATRAKLRMAEMLEGAVDELEKIVMAPAEEMAPAIRLKAIDTLFDRANLPRQTAQSVDHSGEVSVIHTDITAVIQGRLDRLAETLTSSELSGIEIASVPGELAEEPESA